MTTDTIIKLPVEPVLDGVMEEDKCTVRDVIYVLYSLKLCSSWSVLSHQHDYEVSGVVDLKKDILLDFSDMDLIKHVDPLRINHMGLRVSASPGNVVLWIKILRKGEPIVLEEQEIIRVRKRRRWWSGLG